MRKTADSRVSGGWLPANREAAADYLKNLRSEVGVERFARAGEGVYQHESIQKFRSLIDEDPIIQMYFTKMIDQVPGYYKNTADAGGFYLKSIDEMLTLLDVILDRAPQYNETDLVGFPINLILDWTMGVPAGFAVFRNERLNHMLKEILDEWCELLSSRPSLAVLNEGNDGWKCEAARKQLNMSQYDYQPDDEYWGFNSFNDFFTRRLAKNPDGSYKNHPIAEPGNSKVIVSACDSEVYAIKSGVKEKDWFWVKAQPYSLIHMLAGDAGDQSDQHFNEYVKPFIGGDIYQAFLSATKYHRWHSPVSGKIKKAFIKPGTYYSQAESEGMDSAGPNDSQGYITHVATRAIIFIEADDPVGLMCVMPVGMAEVSSCMITVAEGDRVKKGQELGYFQYGGSTHCLVFRPNVIEKFNVKVGASLKMGEQIATAW